MRRALYPLLVALLAISAMGAATPSCGTCDSLGYQCVGTVNIPLDDCGAPVNASTCPVTSCSDYCLSMYSLTGGYCSQSMHECVCDTGSDCDRPLCDRMIDRFAQCIPAETVDACTNTTIPVDSCPTTHAPCDSKCTCSSSGTCTCPPVPVTTPIGATVATPVKAADVPTLTRITTGSKMFIFGSGAIGGTFTQAAVALFTMVAVAHTSYNKRHPSELGH